MSPELHADNASLRAPQARAVTKLLAEGGRLLRQGRFADAARSFQRVIAVQDDDAQAHAYLGMARHREGDMQGALASYRRARQIEPGNQAVRRSLAILLLREGLHDESLALWAQEWASGPAGRAWIQDLVTQAMKERQLSLAGEYATVAARLRWGVGLLDPADAGPSPDDQARQNSYPLSAAKLRHDMGQFEYLLRQGVLKQEVVPVIEAYREVFERLAPRGPGARIPLDSAEYLSIRHAYNRLVYTRPTPRVRRALSGSWDPAAVQSQYLDHPPGVVYVDDFLSAEALAELRAFCLESTIWQTNRYAHGRIGSFFQDGFNCPLLLQIAEELRLTLPRVIGRRYPLRQLWGFKSGPALPADATTHADFAAVNVNFWVTPDDANLDQSSGGLIVYDVDAPLHWDFQTYNGRSDAIKPFLRRQQSRAMKIPYRQNRAVIFNSDLFHGTDRVDFREGYENLRVNITFLYGDRENDLDHRNLSRDEYGSASPYPSAWRSAAFRHRSRSEHDRAQRA
jgi:hypothetical protein